jgi:AraC-like DNA-binding protein
MFYLRVVKAKIYIDEHYASSLNLENLCREACFSKIHFLRLFKRIYNKTPHQYLSEKRLEKAKEKLKVGTLRISDVCADVGFESVASFSLKFKEYTGQPPALFRLRAMQTKKLSIEEPERFIPSCFSSMF